MLFKFCVVLRENGVHFEYYIYHARDVLQKKAAQREERLRKRTDLGGKHMLPANLGLYRRILTCSFFKCNLAFVVTFFAVVPSDF